VTKGSFKLFTILIFVLTALGIGALVFLPKNFFSPKDGEVSQTRVVIPQAAGTAGNPSERGNRSSEDAIAVRAEFPEGESVVSVLTRDFDGDRNEEQIIAYRNLQEIDTPIYVTYVDYNDFARKDVRIWNAATAATRPATLILSSADLIGDRGICVIVSGMNGAGEQTMTIFRKTNVSWSPDMERPVSGPESDEPFMKIAEFIIEGSIAVQEYPRSYEYQQGIANGQSYTIATYGRDYESSNMLDQIETTYVYNQVNGLYEQSKVVKIPGTQIEQRRVQELLTGAPGQFEAFIEGLWFRSGPDGAKRFVYFNPPNREVIFYANDAEEVFSWENSNPTRNGLHITSRNNSLTKLRRTINVELESLESLRLRVYQDTYMRSSTPGPSTIWDGSYQRVQTLESSTVVKQSPPYLDGAYRGSSSNIVFSRDGSYELLSGTVVQKGKYVFFTLGSDELLELRPSDPPDLNRETFKVVRGIDEENSSSETLNLTRIRIGTKGIQVLHEASISLTRTG
jgi:hypothetical protein